MQIVLKPHHPGKSLHYLTNTDNKRIKACAQEESNTHVDFHSTSLRSKSSSPQVKAGVLRKKTGNQLLGHRQKVTDMA
jgi:hypothetical protein